MSDVRHAIALASARKKMKLEMTEDCAKQLKYYKRMQELLKSGRPDHALEYLEILVAMTESRMADLLGHINKPRRKRDYATK